MGRIRSRLNAGLPDALAGVTDRGATRVTNPFLSLWLDGADPWARAACGEWCAEVRQAQARMMCEAAEQAIRLWSGAWMLPGPGRDRSVAERAAALSLRVIEGGRR